ncbi:hypothetical protein [Ureibacillus acetophenoni]
MNSRCFFNTFKNELLQIDGYIRRRLRVAMIHKHPSQRKGWAMSSKWTIEYFTRIGLVPSFQYYYGQQYGHTTEDYINYMKQKGKKKYENALKRAKEKGQEYFNPERVRKMNYANRLATY